MSCVAEKCLVFFLVFAAPPMVSRADVTFLGPFHYLSFEDSPFALQAMASPFFLEDFEDGIFDLPAGVTASGLFTDFPVQPPAPTTDSVDADDGSIDGFGTEGFSLRPEPCCGTLTCPSTVSGVLSFHFDSGELGYLPNAFGFAWTDGWQDPDSPFITNVSLHVQLDNGTQESMTWYTSWLDASDNGSTAEDRFPWPADNWCSHFGSAFLVIRLGLRRPARYGTNTAV